MQSLAAAPLEAVLKRWAGLGYYRRARMLHQTARRVVAERGGEFPQSLVQLRKLPGIGAYTAGAVASIAWGQETALVDGNVERVLSRWLALPNDVRSASGKKTLWAAAERLVKGTRPGDFNQGLMELGSRVCTPTKPACDNCPTSPWCKAYELGDPERFPVKPVAKAPTLERWHCLLLRAPEREALWLGRLSRGVSMG